MENKFNANLRNLRKKNNFTLEVLGKALNISKSTLSDYEIGKTSPPFDVCERIADFFGINIDELRSSGISESSDTILSGIGLRSNLTERDSTELLAALSQKSQLEFQNKLLGQQVEGLQIQLKLVYQIAESKGNEIRSLQMQIRLLEEKLENVL